MTEGRAHELVIIEEGELLMLAAGVEDGVVTDLEVERQKRTSAEGFHFLNHA